MDNLDASDIKLVESATSFLVKQFVEDRHHIACGLRCEDKTYYSLHMDSKGFDVCAEPITLFNALMDKQSSFMSIVAISWDGSGIPKVVPPCGNCRQILSEYIPELKVILQIGDSLQKTSVESLLPYPYE